MELSKVSLFRTKRFSMLIRTLSISGSTLVIPNITSRNNCYSQRFICLFSHLHKILNLPKTHSILIEIMCCALSFFPVALYIKERIGKKNYLF